MSSAVLRACFSDASSWDYLSSTVVILVPETGFNLTKQVLDPDSVLVNRSGGPGGAKDMASVPREPKSTDGDTCTHIKAGGDEPRKRYISEPQRKEQLISVWEMLRYTCYFCLSRIHSRFSS